MYGVNLLGLSAAGVSNCTLVDGGAWTYLNDIASLGALQDNSGPTWTHALLAGSNAIDGDNLLSMACSDGNGALVTDQRGRPRIVGAQCDVGAFEYSPLSFLYLPLVVR